MSSQALSLRRADRPGELHELERSRTLQYCYDVFEVTFGGLKEEVRHLLSLPKQELSQCKLKGGILGYDIVIKLLDVSSEASDQGSPVDEPQVSIDEQFNHSLFVREPGILYDTVSSTSGSLLSEYAITLQPEEDVPIRSDEPPNGDPCEHASRITQLEFANTMLRREVRLVREQRDEQIAEVQSTCHREIEAVRSKFDRKIDVLRRAFTSMNDAMTYFSACANEMLEKSGGRQAAMLEDARGQAAMLEDSRALVERVKVTLYETRRVVRQREEALAEEIRGREQAEEELRIVANDLRETQAALRRERSFTCCMF